MKSKRLGATSNTDLRLQQRTPSRNILVPLQARLRSLQTRLEGIKKGKYRKLQNKRIFDEYVSPDDSYVRGRNLGMAGETDIELKLCTPAYIWRMESGRQKLEVEMLQSG